MKTLKGKTFTREDLEAMRRKNFKPSFSVMIETAGPDKWTLLPILEHLAMFQSDGSGTCLMNMVWDADWRFPRKGASDTRAQGGLRTARAVYARILPIAQLLRPYVKLRLMQDNDPDQQFKVLQVYKKGRPPKSRSMKEIAAARRKNTAKRRAA